MNSPIEWSKRVHSEKVTSLMFDYETLSETEIAVICDLLPRKLLRWIGINHPDNRMRLRFFRLTGVEIGEGTVINANLMLYDDYSGLVSFGSRVAVAADVTIVASSDPNNSLLATDAYVCEHLLSRSPVVVEDDVWLGARCVLLPGVTIGEQSIVAAGAVVRKNVARRTVVAGVPAREIRKLT